MPKSLDIAIAGAGPAGLATALSLHRDGHRVHIFERFESVRPIGSGLILQPTGQAVMAELDLLEAIRALGRPLDRLIGHDAHSGRTVLDMRYAALPRLGRGLGIHRAALFGVLHGAVVESGIPVSTGAEITALEGGVLELGGRREGPFDLVVDAMGSNSPLRACVRGPARRRALPFAAIWGTVPWVDDGFDGAALMQRYVRSSVMIGVLPIGRQTTGGPDLAAFFWSVKADDYEDLVRTGYGAWSARVADLWPATAPHLAALGNFSNLSLARYQHQTAAVPVGDGLVAVGDAAHSTSPQLGQGANMALLDARALTVALRDPELGNALERYAALRRSHVRLYQAMSLALTPFYQSESRFLPILRDLVVPIATSVPPLPQFLAALVAGNLLNPLKQLGLSAVRI